PELPKAGSYGSPATGTCCSNARPVRQRHERLAGKAHLAAAAGSPEMHDQGSGGEHRGQPEWRGEPISQGAPLHGAPDVPWLGWLHSLNPETSAWLSRSCSTPTTTSTAPIPWRIGSKRCWNSTLAATSPA